MYQRSGDLFLGVPFNIASVGLLTYILSDFTNLKPGKIIMILGDAHIYQEHINPVKEQLKRTPYPLPKLFIKQRQSRINIEDYQLDDFILKDYKYHPKISAKMIV